MYGIDTLGVEAVAAPELQLQPLEAASHLLGAPRHVVGIAEPDRPRRRRAGARQPEQLVDGPTDELALEIVQRGVDRRAGGLLARRQAGHDLLDRERVVADEARMLLDIRECRL